jgi:heptosyltransferase-2
MHHTIITASRSRLAPVPVPERILIVKIAALGDAVMASTLVTVIRRAQPDAHIGWVAGHAIAPFVRLIDGIDAVIEVDDAALLSGRRRAALPAMIGAWNRIGRGWHRAIIGHTDERYRYLALMSGARAIRQFSGALAPRRGEWHGSEYARLYDAEALGIGIDALPPLNLAALPPPPAFAGAAPLVVVAPGGARNLLRDDDLRRWPIASWSAVVRALVASGHRVVAIGGAADRVDCTACEDAGAFNLCGQTTIPELLALMRAASILVTHDSGAMHLAFALQIPVVALFGPTRPEERVPSGAEARVLTRAAELPCAPCYDGHSFAACDDNRCLSRVEVRDVIDAIDALLAPHAIPEVV